MISCSSTFKEKISGNVRYLKAFLVHGSEESEIKTFVLKTGGMGSERFGFGTCYISQANITMTGQVSVGKNEKVKIKLYVDNTSFDDTDGIDSCIMADLSVYSCAKSGGVYTITAYGYLFQNDHTVSWDDEGNTISFADMITKIKDITGKNVVIKGAKLSDSQIKGILNEMTVKRISEQPTVRAYLSQMAESVMGYAYESVSGDFIISHGVASEDTTGMDPNILQSSVDEEFSVSSLTCVTSEGYTDDDGNYMDPVFIIENGSGNNPVKYRGYTTSQAQFDMLKTDILSIHYAPGNAMLFGNPLIEPLDGISFTDGNGDQQFIVCSGEITQTFNGGLLTEILAPGSITDADQQAVDSAYESDETQYQKELKVKELYAVSAKIGSWELGVGYIRDMDTNGRYTGMGQNGVTEAFFAGGTLPDGSDGIFRVSHDGHLYATNATISGNITADTFKLTKGDYIFWIDETPYTLGLCIGIIEYVKDSMGEGTVPSLKCGVSIDGDNINVAGKMLVPSGITVGNTSIASGYIKIIRSDLAVTQEHGTTGETISFGIGSGGYNRGIYDNRQGKWVFYVNQNDDVYINTSDTFNVTGTTKANLAYLQISGASKSVSMSGDSNLFGPYTAKGDTKNDSAINLGWSDCRWKKVYAASSSISTSDEREKAIIGNLDQYKPLFMELRPIAFRWNRPDEEDIYGIHFGLGAQTTEVSMNELGLSPNLAFLQHDYFGPDRNGRTDRYGIAYEEIQMLTMAVVQDHELEIRELKEKIADLESRIEKLSA